MKTPIRPFTVEIKRRGKRVVGESKPSMWADISLQGDEKPDHDKRESERDLPQGHDVHKPAPGGRILPDLSSNANAAAIEQNVVKRADKT